MSDAEIFADEFSSTLVGVIMDRALVIATFENAIRIDRDHAKRAIENLGLSNFVRKQSMQKEVLF